MGSVDLKVDATQPPGRPGSRARKTPASTILATVSLILAAGVTLWLAFWPYSYSGTTVSSDGGQVATHGSLFQANGLWVLLVLLFPTALTAIGFFIVKNANPGHLIGKISLLMCPVLLLMFCLVAAFSVGMFYFPSTLLLLIASVMVMGRPAARADSQRTG